MQTKLKLSDILVSIPEIGDAALTAKLEKEFDEKGVEHVIQNSPLVKEALVRLAND